MSPREDARRIRFHWGWEYEIHQNDYACRARFYGVTFYFVMLGVVRADRSTFGPEPRREQ